MAAPSVVGLGVGIHDEAQVAVGRAVAVVPTPAIVVALKREAVP